jgi:hypothetical protein
MADTRDALRFPISADGNLGGREPTANCGYSLAVELIGMMSLWPGTAHSTEVFQAIETL